DAADSKSAGGNTVPVRFRPPAPTHQDHLRPEGARPSAQKKAPGTGPGEEPPWLGPQPRSTPDASCASRIGRAVRLSRLSSSAVSDALRRTQPHATAAHMKRAPHLRGPLSGEPANQAPVSGPTLIVTIVRPFTITVPVGLIDTVALYGAEVTVPSVRV